MESLKLLYHVAEDWLSPITVLDLENHFKKPVRLSYQSAFDSPYRYEKKIQLETGEICYGKVTNIGIGHMTGHVTGQAR